MRTSGYYRVASALCPVRKRTAVTHSNISQPSEFKISLRHKLSDLFRYPSHGEHIHPCTWATKGTELSSGFLKVESMGLGRQLSRYKCEHLSVSPGHPCKKFGMTMCVYKPSIEEQL